MNARRTRTALLALVSAPLVLTLVACGGDDSSSTDSTPAASTASSTSSAAAGTTTPAAPDTTAAPVGDDALAAAAATALGEVDGTVFSIDLDNGAWDVSVVAPDGTESDLTVSADGTQVTRGPVVDTDDSDDTDDLAERRTLLQDATVTYDAALATARTEVPGGTVDGLDLELDDGQATWDVQLDENTADEQTVVVDAVTGEVLRVERDD
ncbi:PepSY domain-containing protein [Nocardioides sp.]|uniref:PepSY domain-containing protein n=1 Tax=Nocardioides sp. TaxID=35761 RepID=UPI002720130B|nr:PepSY domain-containing protein [Nocardioides sp.]MDO9455684.1 PepSY domain-containing protein [Nocardioides sp.]